MNPFAYSQTGGRPSIFGRLMARPALIVFGVSLLLGVAAVAWRAKARAEAGRSIGRSEARALGAAVELQINRAIAAVEVLGAVAKQGGGTMTDFQGLAATLLTTHPGIAALEMQPGGVVTDVAPRAGHLQWIGRNVFNDLLQRSDANTARQSRQLTISGPLALESGAMGIVVRLPVFLQGRDGRDSFWGFVAATMRLPETLSRARVDEVVERGYDYVFFVPATAQHKAIGIAASVKGVALRDTVQQPIRLPSLEFRLALQPRAGWLSKTRVVLELVAVGMTAGLLGLLVNLVENRQALESALADSNQRLGRESSDRKQAQADSLRAKEQLAAAQADLEQARTAQRQVESTAAELLVRLEAASQSTDQNSAAAQVQKAELAEAQERIAQLQAQFDASARAEQAATSVTAARLQEALETIADLKARVEADARAAQEAAEAQAGRLKEAEELSRALKEGLEEAEQAALRLAEEGDSQSGGGRMDASNPVPAAESTSSPAEGERIERREPVAEPELTDSDEGREGLKAPAPKSRALRVSKRKKNRSDRQMDFFGVQSPQVEGEGQVAPEVKAGEGAGKKEPGPPHDTGLAASLSVEDGPGGQAGDLEWQTPDPPGGSGEPSTAGQAEGTPWSGEGEALIPAAEPSSELSEIKAEVEAEAPEPVSKPPPVRRAPTPPAVNPAQLRKAVHLIVPLLTDQDPGAKDCLKDNRSSFRSAFSPEGWQDFEQLMKHGDFGAALDQLKKAARKHGISV